MLSPTEQLYYTRHNKRAILGHTAVWRHGVTAKDWDHEASSIVEISRFERKTQSKNRDDALSLRFTIPSKGGGETEIDVLIGQQDFPALLALMSAVDGQSALKAMVEELRHQICGPDH
jgi:hypothetical protein